MRNELGQIGCTSELTFPHLNQIEANNPVRVISGLSDQENDYIQRQMHGEKIPAEILYSVCASIFKKYKEGALDVGDKRGYGPRYLEAKELLRGGRDKETVRILLAGAIVEDIAFALLKQAYPDEMFLPPEGMFQLLQCNVCKEGSDVHLDEFGTMGIMGTSVPDSVVYTNDAGNMRIKDIIEITTYDSRHLARSRSIIKNFKEGKGVFLDKNVQLKFVVPWNSEISKRRIELVKKYGIQVISLPIDTYQIGQLVTDIIESEYPDPYSATEDDMQAYRIGRGDRLESIRAKVEALRGLGIEPEETPFPKSA